MSRAQLIEIIRNDLAHGKSGTQDQADAIVRVPVENYYDRGRSVMLSQLFPGQSPETSYTNQIFLMEEKPPTEQLEKEAREQFKFLEYVVQEEDCATGIALQKNLPVGAKPHVLFGRNERGGQYFHRWVDTLLETADDDLPALFRDGLAWNSNHA